jgi:hypothetical protein
MLSKAEDSGPGLGTPPLVHVGPWHDEAREKVMKWPVSWASAFAPAPDPFGRSTGETPARSTIVGLSVQGESA